LLVLEELPRPAGRAASWASRRTVVIGLINNMGDEALKVTERQFGGLLSASIEDVDVRLRLFALKGTPRSPSAVEFLDARYEPASEVMRSGLDALIITGAPPRARRLNEEPYWRELIEIIDWAKENTASIILSCLAAHAGVLHLDGVERRPLSEKCLGVFDFWVTRDHPFVGRQGSRRVVPHSRHNGLLQSDLESAGYEVLTSSPVHGVDCFTKSFGSQFVFFQGHPEYDADSLAREHRRDLGRYLRGETDAKPPAPQGYFEREAELELGGLHRLAHENPDRFASYDLSKVDELAPRRAKWRSAATTFFRNWMELAAARSRSGETSSPQFQALVHAPMQPHGWACASSTFMPQTCVGEVRVKR
jgi:homoserine O-succinyltransferase/O-acetyltransferase